MAEVLHDSAIRGKIVPIRVAATATLAFPPVIRTGPAVRFQAKSSHFRGFWRLGRQEWPNIQGPHPRGHYLRR